MKPFCTGPATSGRTGSREPADIAPRVPGDRDEGEGAAAAAVSRGRTTLVVRAGSVSPIRVARPSPPRDAADSVRAAERSDRRSLTWLGPPLITPVGTIDPRSHVRARSPSAERSRRGWLGVGKGFTGHRNGVEEEWDGNGIEGLVCRFGRAVGRCGGRGGYGGFVLRPPRRNDGRPDGAGPGGDARRRCVPR